MIQIDIHKKLSGANGPFTLQASLSIGADHITGVFAPSGAGKTTLLRMIAGLSNPDSGRIVVDGDTWFDSAAHVNMPVRQRRVGYVFQEYNLFPNMTLRENLYFALGKNDDPKDVNALLILAKLEKVADMYPRVLSGGQKQRAALMRALLRRPKILLLDEPFCALDIPTRVELQKELKIWQAKMKVPTLFVSHDIADILRISTDMLMIKDDRVVSCKRDDLAFGDDPG